MFLLLTTSVLFSFSFLSGRLGLMNNESFLDLLLIVRKIFVGLGIVLVLLGKEILETRELRRTLWLWFSLSSLGLFVQSLELVGSFAGSALCWSSHGADGTAHACLGLGSLSSLGLVAKLWEFALVADVLRFLEFRHPFGEGNSFLLETLWLGLSL
jgi:hypothetical protein